MKSISAFAILALLVPSSVTAQSSLPPFPKKRFTPWKYRDVGPVQSLGYTEETWNLATNFDDSNPVEDIPYAELTTEQRQAVTNLGITEEAWECWVHKYASYFWEELSADKQEAWAKIGWQPDQWDIEFSIPESYTKFWVSLNATEREGAEAVCFTEQIWNSEPLDRWYHHLGPDSLSIPIRRYTPWASLDRETRNIAINLGYDENTWNNFGEAEIEFLDWFDLSDEQRGFATDLGMDQPTWDCYVNHYEGYGWEDFAYRTVNLQEVFRLFGFRKAETWNFGPSPELYRSFWSMFDGEQKQALKQVCYDNYLWDAIPLNEWPYYVAPGDLEWPRGRFTPWKKLKKRTRQVATDVLGYTEESWDLVGTNEIEEEGWFSLTDEQREAFTTIGITQSQYDCYLNHWEDHSWENLQRGVANVAPYFETLGYNEASWEGNADAPAASAADWSALTAEQQAAMEKVCWTEEAWQGTLDVNNLPSSSSRFVIGSSIAVVVVTMFAQML